MKKVIFILSCLILITSIFIFLKYDSKGYYFGYGCLFCEKSLPYNLNPHVNEYYTFSLKKTNDKGFDFQFIGMGFKFKGSDVKIKKILGYGYNKKEVIVKCLDQNNNPTYFTTYKSKKSLSMKELGAKNINKKEFIKWTKLNEEKGDHIRIMKTFSVVGFIISLITILIFSIRKFKKSQINIQ